MRDSGEEFDALSGDSIQKENSAWALDEREIDRLLASRDDERLRRLFGSQYPELKELAREAANTARGEKATVVFLPGILGSTLGRERRRLFSKETIWLNPVSIIAGKIAELSLPGRNDIVTFGTVPLYQTYLRLRLKIAGFNFRSFPYDWRKSVLESGKDLLAFIRTERLGEVSVVAHSMGGLVARAALADRSASRLIKRLVMLGTPNRGSFSAVQVLQGLNSTVQMVDRLDLHHTMDQLVTLTFSTFPSVYELLPHPEVFDRVKLFDAAVWPKKPFKPLQVMLRKGAETRGSLAGPNANCHLIAGYGQETVTDLEVNAQGAFDYLTASDGDGTVPLRMCQLPGVDTRYTPATHMGLVANERVAKAVIELLEKGKTEQLDDAPQSERRGASRRLTQRDFLSGPESLGGRRGDALSDDDEMKIARAAMTFSSVPARQVLNEVSEAEGPEVPSVRSAGFVNDVSIVQTSISQDRQTAVDVELCFGSLFDVPYRAIVLGIFQDVEPTGPAVLLNGIMDGAVMELIQRRMFQGSAGKVFVMPTGRNPLKAEHVVFMGMGDFASFMRDPAGVLRLASSNTLRTLLRCGVDEMATIIYGGASGFSIRESVRSMMNGYLEAIQSLESNECPMNFRRLGLCEIDPQRYSELKSEVIRYAFTRESSDLRMRLHEPRYPATRFETTEPVARGRLATRPVTDDMRGQEVSYLNVRIERSKPHLRATLLTSGGAAAVFPSVKRIDESELETMIRDLPASNSVQSLRDAGEKLSQLLFTDEFLEMLKEKPLDGTHLCVVHDAEASRIPWETVTFGHKEFPAVTGGVSRRHESDGEPGVAKHWLLRQNAKELKVLLIVNPTEDLDGADMEGDSIRKTMTKIDGIVVKEISGPAARKAEILREFESGDHDIIHYAGHAFFDAQDRRRSGLICAEGEILRGEDLNRLDKLPSLVFFNACESGRIRSSRGGTRIANKVTKKQKVDEFKKRAKNRLTNVGVAEALLNGGIAQFLGTYWPVSDRAAKNFAEAFYRELVKGSDVAEAVRQGRLAVKQINSIDFSDYIHFGSPGFRVKLKARS